MDESKEDLSPAERVKQQMWEDMRQKILGHLSVRMIAHLDSPGRDQPLIIASISAEMDLAGAMYDSMMQEVAADMRRAGFTVEVIEGTDGLVLT